MTMMRLLYGLATLLLSANVVEGFVPSGRNAKISTEQAKNPTLSAVSNDGNWRQRKVGGTVLASSKKAKKASNNEAIPVVAHGLALGLSASAASLLSLAFHLNPITLLGGGAVMAGAAAFAGKQAASSSGAQSVSLESDEEEPFYEYEETLDSAKELYYEELEALDDVESTFHEAVGADFNSQDEFHFEYDDDIDEYAASLVYESEQPAPTAFEASNKPFEETDTTLPHIVTSPLEVVDPQEESNGVDTFSFASPFEDVHTPLVPATALYSSSKTTHSDAEPISMRTKIDRLKAELDLAEKFFDENLY